MTFWSGNGILARQQRDKLIAPFDENRIDCSAYELSLGAHAYCTSDDDDRKEALKAGRVPGEKKLGDQEFVTIQPGQFAFLLTEEVVTIPKDTIAFISVKARRKLEGLINVSGFHVDPGWSGKLIFGVFNAGSRPLTYQRGKPLFLIFFADLLPFDSNHVYTKTGVYQTIPAEMIQNMSDSVPSLYKLDKETRKLKDEAKSTETSTRVTQWIAGIAIAVACTALTKAFFPSLGEAVNENEVEVIVQRQLDAIRAEKANGSFDQNSNSSAEREPVIMRQAEPLSESKNRNGPVGN